MSWADRLERLAMSGLSGTPLARDTATDPEVWLEGFRDEWGHHRAVDRPMLAWLLGIDPGPTPDDPRPDVRLWWAIHDRTNEPMDVIQPSGALVHREAHVGLEVWTESELGALHALWDLAVQRDRSDLSDRCIEAARIHLDQLQPDNATNHPWAVHVFVEMARRGSAEALLYAQLLVSNAQVGLGRPDRFSACLLLDASRMIRARSPE